MAYKNVYGGKGVSITREQPQSSVIDLTSEGDSENSATAHSQVPASSFAAAPLAQAPSKAKEKEKEKEQRKKPIAANPSGKDDDSEDDGDDFVKPVPKPKAAPKKPPEKSVKTQSKLVKGKKGEVKLTISSSSSSAAAPATAAEPSADYVVDPNDALGGCFDEFDLQTNRLRKQLHEVNAQKSILEDTERKIRNQIKAVEKKQREFNRNRYRTMEPPAPLAEETFSDEKMAALFPLRFDNIGSTDEIVVDLDKKRQRRVTQPLFELASMHSQFDTIAAARESFFENCTLDPTLGRQQLVDENVKEEEDETPEPAETTSSKLETDLSSQNRSNEMSKYSQVLLLFDEAEALARQENQLNESDAPSLGPHLSTTNTDVPMLERSLSQHHGASRCQLSLPFSLSYISNALDAAPDGWRHRTAVNERPVSPSERIEYWSRELSRHYFATSQDNLQYYSNSSSRDNLASRIFRAVDAQDSESSANSLALHTQHEAVMSELQCNLESLLRCRRQQQGGKLDDEEEAFMQKLLEACLTSRVLADGVSYHASRLNQQLLEKPHSHTFAGASAPVFQQECSPAAGQKRPGDCDPASDLPQKQQQQQYLSQQSHQSSRFDDNDWICDDGVIYGGGDGEDVYYGGGGDGSDHGEDDVFQNFTGPSQTQTIDLITPDSPPVAVLKNASSPNRVILIDSIATNRADSGQRYFFANEFLAIDECPDFMILTDAELISHCVEVGLSTSLSHTNATPLLKGVWKDLRMQFLAKSQPAGIAGPKKVNKRKTSDKERQKGGGVKKQKPQAEALPAADSTVPQEGSRVYDNDARALCNLKMSMVHIHQVVEFIQGNEDFFEKVLLFRPIALDELYSALQGATPRINVAKEHLKNFLDSQAVFMQQGNLGDKYAGRK